MDHEHPMRWTLARAKEWRDSTPWYVGCNFIPSSAINQMEMWQGASFDIDLIKRELDLAAVAGMNSVRVYLHDLLWTHEGTQFLDRIDIFLAAAADRGIKTMLVLFDSCWNSAPAAGPQPAATPGVHNSGWVQSPGTAALADHGQHPRLKEYVQAVVGRFASDERVLAWDIWNEPYNGPEVDLCNADVLHAKALLVLPVLSAAFDWAREMLPVQPLTSAIWLGDWSSHESLSLIQRVQVQNSDIISFHNYGDGPDFLRRVEWLQQMGRPLICSEFMARPVGSTFAAILPVAKEHVGAFCWGLVCGKTQTHLPWDSWATPYVDGPVGSWFHDVFNIDGTPYDPTEIELIRGLTLNNAPAEPVVSGERKAA